MRGLFFFLLLLCCFLREPLGVFAASQVNDGFVPVQIMGSRFFSLELAAGVDAGALVRALDISPGDRILAGQNLAVEGYNPEDLGSLLDALFLWSCGVLDMPVSHFEGTIRVSATAADMKAIVMKIYGMDALSEKGFYLAETNTLYIAAEDFTKEVVGHEMGHAIINSFFVVQPPFKVQEVLAGYIEYQIRKTGVEPRL
jgi:hypothetical protein